MSKKMYNQNPDQKVPMMNPRISFSNNAFLHDSSHSSSSSITYQDAPVSDFEFSAVAGSRGSIISADELFSKGRLLPYHNKGKITTLRDELRNDDDDDDDDECGEITLKPPKNPTKLKGFLGLKKSHISSKKLPVIKAQESAERSSQDSGEGEMQKEAGRGFR